MTALPAFPTAPPLKESLSPRDVPPPQGTNKGKESIAHSDASAGAKEPSRSDGNGSSFEKILREKKAERESAEKEKTEPADNGTKDKNAVKHNESIRSVRAHKSNTVSPSLNKKTSTVKNILSGLMEKKQSAKESKAKDEAKPEKTGRLAELFMAVRPLALREANAKTAKSSDAIAELKRALSKGDEKKTARLVVIVDLRSRALPVLKSKTGDDSRKIRLARTVAKSETREAKKTLKTKEDFEVKVWHKPGALPDTAEHGPRATGPEAARPRSDFSSRLADVMKNEMVKHTGFVLKDGGSGEIHLVLKPESLGSVRIRLNLDDNHIVGKIIVDNNSVKQIMEENLGHLETALQENGYQAAAFDVSVAGERRNAPEEGTFSDLIDGERMVETSPAGTYEAGGASIYADSLVNIVL
ncbi:MAG: flagellar hook-length control protein FliK [Spirochaetales bacterium]|nr:flagellar hook-length control protein FliK [Spirochaetales bacterium]